MSSYIDAFAKKLSLDLADINDKFILLEHSPGSVVLLDDLYRVLHTVKGEASILGIVPVKIIVHCLEDLVTLVKQKKEITDELIKKMWNGYEILVRIDQCMIAMGGIGVEFNDIAADYERDFSLITLKINAVAGNSNHRYTDRERFFCASTELTRQVSIVKAFFEGPVNGTINVSPQSFSDAVNYMAECCRNNGFNAQFSELMSALSDYEEFSDDQGMLPLPVLRTIAERFFSVFMFLDKITHPEGDNEEVADDEIERIVSDIKYDFRVSSDELDVFFDIAKRFGVILGFLEKKCGLTDVSDQKSNAVLLKSIADLTDVNNDLLSNLLKVKYVRPDSFIEKNCALVKLLARKCAKDVRIESDCGDVMIERHCLELLENIFIHVVRNSIDHGIEPPDERIKLDKEPAALIRINMHDDESSLYVSVSDDGRGIDLDAVRAKAVVLGLVEKDKVMMMTDEDVIKFIFEPGFTLKNGVTEVSGRGVGLNVVFDSLRKNGAAIEVETVKGKGTKFNMRFPKQNTIKLIPGENSAEK